MRRQDNAWEMRMSDEIAAAPLPTSHPPPPTTIQECLQPTRFNIEEDLTDLNFNTHLVRTRVCACGNCRPAPPNVQLVRSHACSWNNHVSSHVPSHVPPVVQSAVPPQGPPCVHSHAAPRVPSHSVSCVPACVASCIPSHGLSQVSSNASVATPSQSISTAPTTSPTSLPTSADDQRSNMLKGLVLCQIASLLICGTAVFSRLLVDSKVDIPTLQSFGNYCLLAIVYTISYLSYTPNDVIWRTFKERWWKYFLLALFDVEGNYMMVKAYQYTSITSVQLLDSVTIPVVLALSWMCLRYRYLFIHVGGVAIAMVGMGIMIYGDVKREANITNETLSLEIDVYNGSGLSVFSNNLSWAGDLLAIMGATCYGFSNVGQEYFVNNVGQHEFLAALGFFGALINGVQFAALEWREASDVAATGSTKVCLYIIGFNLCLFFIYSTVPKALQLTSAAAFNVSILTSDFYTFLFGLFLFRLPLDASYFLAYILVIVGIVVYSWRPVPHR